MTVTEARAHIVVVGAGHAGGTAVALLRQYGWQDAITLIGEEALPPYERPPLSKGWLTGDADPESLFLRPAGFYADQNIALRLSTRITAIDRAARHVRLEAGGTLSYDYLILALGSRARRIPLPGIALDGVLELRGVTDADRLKAALGPGKRIGIVGGGYIGLEVAASARALGTAVTILEREDRVLSRVACPALSDFFHGYHKARGVTFELGARIEALDGDGAVSAVRLSDGRRLPCDAVLMGVGAVANDDLARDAGLACDNGIIVDPAARTSDRAIFAIGDCARRPLPLYGRDWRLESVQNALEQARQAAEAICGRAPSAPEVPWFWSDQYDLHLQIAGIPFDAARIVRRGDPAGGSFAMFHLADDDRLLAVEAVNAPQEFLGGKRMIGRRQRLNPDRIGDLTLSVRDLPA